MFFNKESLSETGIFQGFTDYHSHILYGVDDGVDEKEKSLEALSCLEGLGITTVWLTPHIMEDIPNATEDLRRRYNDLLEAYPGTISLNLAAEYMLDSLFQKRLEEGDLLPLKSDCLLVETSCFNPPFGLVNIFGQIRAKGYFPLLAHPERYAYLEIQQYEELKKLGVGFQMNLFSLAGMYGRSAGERARLLLKKGWYDCIGTDLHSLRLFAEFISRKVISSNEREKLLRITRINGRL